MGGIFKGFSGDSRTLKQFGEFRTSFKDDIDLITTKIEDMRKQQLNEQAKADEALDFARKKANEIIIKKKINEEKKQEHYIQQMNYIKNVAATGGLNAAFLTRLGGLQQRQSLMGKK